MLASFNLRVLKRPSDGACLYWSVGTGRGDYDEHSFDLQGDGEPCTSQVEWEAKVEDDNCNMAAHINKAERGEGLGEALVGLGAAPCF